MPRTRVLAVVAVGVLAVGLLVGCSRMVTGSGTPPPRAADLITRTVATMKALPHGFAVTIEAEIAGETSRVQARLHDDDAEGTVTRNGVRGEVRRVDGQAYARAAAAYWRQVGLDEADAASLDGRWTTVPDGSPVTSGLDPAIYYRILADDVDLASVPVRSATVDGVRVWTLTAGGQTVAIAADGAPRLIRQDAGNLGSISVSYPTDGLQVSKPDDVVPYPG